MSYREVVIQIEQAMQRKRQYEVISKLHASWAQQDGEEIERLRTVLAGLEPDDGVHLEPQETYDRGYNELEDVPSHIEY